MQELPGSGLPVKPDRVCFCEAQNGATEEQSRLQALYMEGRRGAQMDASSCLYLGYICTRDSMTCQKARALHGRVWRKDDPIWKKIYPPNGPHCRCSVQGYTQRQLDRKGLTVEYSEEYLAMVAQAEREAERKAQMEREAMVLEAESLAKSSGLLGRLLWFFSGPRRSR